MITSPAADRHTTSVDTARPSFFDRHAWPIALALVAFHAALAWIARAPGILTGHDDTTYIVLGRSLQSLQYRELHRIDAPVHMLYPPVYPAMLGIWSAIGGDRFNWLVLIGIACSAGTLALTFAAVSKRWNPRIALCCLGALAVNPALIEFAGMVASESPFTFFQSLALWALSVNPVGPALLVVGGAAGLAAALTRSVGVTLIAAIGLYWLFQRRFRALALYVLISGITVGGWLAWTVRSPEQEQVPGRSYVADATFGQSGSSLTTVVVERLKTKIPYIQELYWRLPVPSVSGTPIDNLIALPIVLIGLTIGLPTLLFRWPLAFLYVATYGALLMVWPWRVGRFLVPLLPVVVPALIVGLSSLVRWLAPRWEIRTAVVTSVALALSGIVPVLAVVEKQKPCDPGAAVPARPCLNESQASFFAATEYVNANVSRDAVFLSGKGATLYYYTGRRVVSSTRAGAQPPDQFLAFLRQQGVTHILLMTVMPYGEGRAGPGAPTFGELVKANCGQLVLEKTFPPASSLFRLPDAGEQPDAAAACAAADTYLEAVKPEPRRDEP